MHLIETAKRALGSCVTTNNSSVTLKISLIAIPAPSSGCDFSLWPACVNA